MESIGTRKFANFNKEKTDNKKGIKIRLKPTAAQEILFWKSAGVARWAYNYCVSEKERVYKEWLDNNKTGNRSIKETEIRKYINNVLKKTTHTWLSEVGNNVMKQGVKDADAAYQKYFAGLAGKPKFKTKHKSIPKFYVNYETLSKTQNAFRGEKLGNVKTDLPLPKLKKGEKYSNPRISYDGKYWYLSVGYDFAPNENTQLTDTSLGIDLGIKQLAVCSNNKKKYKNINKSRRVKQLKKQLKREQKKLSRMLENNIKSYVGKYKKPVFIRPLRECKNFNKQSKKIRLLHKKLHDIRSNYLHQTTSAIVKTKPYRVVMEDLNIKGMMKNKHLSKSIAEEKFYEFIRQMKYKCKWNGIEFVQADRFYPSSKKCSCCGHIKKDLKLSDRIYKCDNCRLIIDRDYNASLNLANYGLV